jgi:hypothetical protein
MNGQPMPSQGNGLNPQQMQIQEMESRNFPVNQLINNSDLYHRIDIESNYYKSIHCN